ncbi:MAG: hypothetical protein COT85_01145 [Chlamydiae bacterium CG10_big_fil_rev_8_21_14_0_10_42_34]|nr:MAG: hypothetical protein COT85_01145 [Chlamydiae bacterium CG10_big_fil_rev_8_21_14_0_10_42_34]
MLGGLIKVYSEMYSQLAGVVDYVVPTETTSIDVPRAVTVATVEQTNKLRENVQADPRNLRQITRNDAVEHGLAEHKNVPVSQSGHDSAFLNMLNLLYKFNVYGQIVDRSTGDIIERRVEKLDEPSS